VGVRPPLTGVTLPGLIRPGAIVALAEPQFFVNIAGGYGIGASGEDAILPRPIRVPLESLTPCGTANQLRTSGAATPPATGAALAPRAFGTDLEALVSFARSQPSASS